MRWEHLGLEYLPNSPPLQIHECAYVTSSLAAAMSSLASGTPNELSMFPPVICARVGLSCCSACHFIYKRDVYSLWSWTPREDQPKGKHLSFFTAVITVLMRFVVALLPRRSRLDSPEPLHCRIHQSRHLPSSEKRLPEWHKGYKSPPSSQVADFEGERS